MWQHRGKVAVAGLGHSKVLRADDGSPEHLGTLAMDSAQKAIADAGLKLEDVDGISVAPHQPFEGAGNVPGVDEITSTYMVSKLKDRGLKNVRWMDDSGGMAGHALILAFEAVAAGKANNVLVMRSMHNPRGIRYGHGGNNAIDRIGGPGQFTSLYGMAGPAGFAALYQRYLWKYNQQREKMATFAVHNRKYGLLNPNSFWSQNRPVELTREDYLNARMICAPLSLNDCDIPVQGSASWIVTTAERARALKQKPVYVLGHGLTRNTGAPSLVQKLDLMESFAAEMSKKLWEACGLSPRDVDVADLYDGYLVIAPIWTEQMGFCKPGEFLDFIQDGRIEATGAFPLNLSSGNNGCGRMHGVPHFYNPVEQLRGQAGKRQVPNAEVALSIVGPQGGGQGIVYGISPN